MKRLALCFVVFAAGRCTCLQVDRPARYACERDAGDPALECPGGWKCGLDGFCFDPARGAALPCADSQTDCGGGWHCGPASFCYDLTDAGAVACRPDAGDCAATWSCGFERICHDRAVGAPYPCERDTDCEQQWRCGPDHKCVNGQLEGLRPTPTGPTLATPLSPSLPMQLPDVVAVGDDPGATGCDGSPVGSYPMSLAYGRRLVRQRAFPFVDGVAIECLPDGGPLRFVHALRSETQLPAPATSLVDTGASTWAVAGATLVHVFADGGSTTVDAGFVPRALKAISNTDGVIAFDERHVATVDEQGTWHHAPPPPFDAGTHVLDVERLPFSTGIDLTETGFVVATDTSLWALSGGGVGHDIATMSWSRAQEGNCGAAQYAFKHLQALQGYIGDPVKVVVEVGTSYGYDAVWVMQVSDDAGSPDSPCPIPDPIGTTGVVLGLFELPCPIFCPHLVDSFATLTRDGGTLMVNRCTEADAGSPAVRYWQSGPNNFCTALNDGELPAPLFEGSRVSRTSSMLEGVVDTYGSAWISRPRTLTWQPIGLPGVPAAAAGTVSGLIVENAAERAGRFDVYTPVPATIAERVEDSGFAGPVEFFDDVLLGPVAGRPTWYAFSEGTFAPFNVFETYGHGYSRAYRPLNVLAAGPELQAPVHLAAAPLADGGTLLMVSSEDFLSAVDVTAREKAQGPDLNAVAYRWSEFPHPQFVLTPLPRANITSLVALAPLSDPDAQASYALGYVAAAGRIFRFHADNPVVWRAEELVVTGAEAVAVWADGQRARAGFRDGQVFSLPARVTLAGAIAPGTSTVVDFAAVGCHVFALTTNGLWRLRAGAAPIGTWERLTLPSEDAGISWATGRLHSDGTALAVFREHGVAERIDVPACP